MGANALVSKKERKGWVEKVSELGVEFCKAADETEGEK